MTELKVIEQQEVLGKDFKVYGDFENPLFLAKDVAEWIENSMGEYGAKKARENGITSTEYSKKIVGLMLEYEQEVNNEN